MVTSDGVVVFDALGTPELGATMKRAIAGVTTQPVRLVIISHYHADRFYGVQALSGPVIALTREYLLYLRDTMGKAARDLVPFEEAYAAVDGSRLERIPAFAAANRLNAYGTYLRMAQEALTPPAGRLR